MEKDRGRVCFWRVAGQIQELSQLFCDCAIIWQLSMSPDGLKFIARMSQNLCSVFTIGQENSRSVSFTVHGLLRSRRDAVTLLEER